VQFSTRSSGMNHKLAKPKLQEVDGAIQASHSELGDYFLSCDGNPELLFTENESNSVRLWREPGQSPWVKDAFHEYVVGGNANAVNPARTGTKAAARYSLDVPAGGSSVVQLRLSANSKGKPSGKDFDTKFAARVADANEFYDRITPASLSEDERLVHRQALAGMLWTKQFYFFDVDL